MHDHIGTWRLVEWTATVRNRTVRPFGGNPVGLLTYTNEGRMWASLMNPDREHLPTGTLAAATAEDRATAAAGYLNYAGAYRWDGSVVYHDVEVSLMPNWVGGTQERLVNWITGPHGADLELSTPPSNGLATDRIVNRLRWRRVAFA